MLLAGLEPAVSPFGGVRADPLRYRSLVPIIQSGRGGTRTPKPGSVDLCDVHFTTRPNDQATDGSRAHFSRLPCGRSTLELRRHLDPAGVEPASSVCKTETLPLSHEPLTTLTARTCLPLESNQHLLLFRQARRPRTQERQQPRRLVGESNPSRPIDSRAATPVASRGRSVWVADGARTRSLRFHRPATRPLRLQPPESAIRAQGVEP